MAELAHKLSGLNPFHRSKVDADDKGEEIQPDSISGAGHTADKTSIAKSDLRVSPELKNFLHEQKILSKHDADVDSDTSTPALRAFLSQPLTVIPPELLDPSHPLPEYFISSSHNTYLLAHQLYGTSSASAYETALKTGSRCVEIDAWDNEDNIDEPKVTHGYTLVSHIPFRQVCEAIAKCIDDESANSTAGTPASPIFISLENHCGPEGQRRLALIMREVFGDRLISKPVGDEGIKHITLSELGHRIAVIVEYHIADQAGDPKPDPETDSSEDEAEEEEKEAQEAEVIAAAEVYEAKKKEKSSGIIVLELFELGVYAQSVKPPNNTWFDPGTLLNGPHHHLINLSEGGLSRHLPLKAAAIARHNSQHLMRVYPKGTRISSSNLKPVPFWATGAQICALNWQQFGLSNQLNAALFYGSEGYVLKPAALRAGGSGQFANPERKKRLRLHVAGAANIPLHDPTEDKIKPYLTCTLHHPSMGEVPKRKTEPYKHHKLGFLHKQNPLATDPIWDETLEWEYDDSELVFLRMLIKSDDSWARNPMFAVAAVRLAYVVEGWRFLRMLDMKGRVSSCLLLVKIEVSDA